MLNSAGLHFNLQAYNFDPFFFRGQFFLFLIIFVYVMVVFSMMLGRKMVEGKWGFSFSMLYFFPVFSIVAPFWLLKAMYNTLLKRRPAWR